MNHNDNKPAEKQVVKSAAAVPVRKPQAKQIGQIPLPASIDPQQVVLRASIPQMREQAIALHKKGELGKAAQLYKTLLRVHPEDVGLWSNLGVVYRQSKLYQSAINCYQQALRLSPEDPAALGNLANVLKDMRRLDEAIALHGKVVLKKPEDASARINYAVAFRENGQYEKALQQLAVAQQLKPDDAGIEWERSQNLLYLGQYEEGFKTYEARKRTGDLPIKTFECPEWLGLLVEGTSTEDLAAQLMGKTLLVHTEQGYGDTILATRFIPKLKALVGEQGRVILQCKPELHRLFARVGADLLINPEQTPGQEGIPAADRHISLMSVLGALGVTPQTIPPPAQLHIPTAARERFAHLAANAHAEAQPIIKVGIIWTGSLTFKANDQRRLPLSAFLHLAEHPHIRLFSLQKGPAVAELYESGADAYIADMGKLCEDFADTAAVIEQMDVIVMTDSSVAHLASSLGKRVINLLNDRPYWLYTLHAEYTPWYPSMEFVYRHEMDQLLARILNKTEVEKRAPVLEQPSPHLWQIKASEAVVKDTGTPKGRGVFATRSYRKGEVVECAPVVLIKQGKALPQPLPHYVFCWQTLTQAVALPPKIKTQQKPMLAIALGFGSLYNHANPANLIYEASSANTSIRFIAARDINANEELSINYSAWGGGALWHTEAEFEE